MSISACECERSIYAASAPALSRKHALFMSELASRVGKQLAVVASNWLVTMTSFLRSA